MTPVTTTKWIMVFIAIFLAFALWTFIAPMSLAQNLGFHLPGNTGLNELRANYGGMYIGIALFLFISIRTPGMVRGAWLFLSLLLGGLAVGRFLSLLLDGMPGPALVFVMCMEIIAALLTFSFYRKEGEV